MAWRKEVNTHSQDSNYQDLSFTFHIPSPFHLGMLLSCFNIILCLVIDFFTRSFVLGKRWHGKGKSDSIIRTKNLTSSPPKSTTFHLYFPSSSTQINFLLQQYEIVLLFSKQSIPMRKSYGTKGMIFISSLVFTTFMVLLGSLSPVH